MNRYSRIYWGYGIEHEGTDRQQVRVLVASSQEGLENQARYFGLTLRGDNWSTVEDIYEFDTEIEQELNGEE
jgi:hypothetical protein